MNPILQVAVGADDRPDDRHASLEGDFGRNHRTAIGQRRGGLRRIAPQLSLQHIRIGLAVALRRTDVEPVSIGDVAIQGQPRSQQTGKEIVLERILTALRDKVEHFWFEQVNSGIDGSSRRDAKRRLFIKLPNPPLSIQFDNAIGPRVGHIDEHQRGRRPAHLMALQNRAQVNVRQNVPVEHDERSRHPRPDMTHGTGGSQRLAFHHRRNHQPPQCFMAEGFLNLARLVRQTQQHFHLPCDIQGTKQIKLVVNERPVGNRHDRLRRMEGERAQACSLAPGQDERLHWFPSL
ncbi:hypothetical protein Cabther_A1264 [Chloracidobacterium thermophilum B]|uniref:Uncharacterized protein n=1 Tax=Chloracidobacterium thermophilum (strain B) TaxID=981222 RepID=G2LEN4_CHLTF|nr:hypothetical protein Cabther_A1264 [Chloracidobacterium thermophilum B]